MRIGGKNIDSLVVVVVVAVVFAFVVEKEVDSLVVVVAVVEVIKGRDFEKGRKGGEDGVMVE